ncbi:patatin-like phospholipase [Sinobaca qinghaiensis]|uniref:Patatin-like phospholipase n=1 Tax=Sinobaca qinghaiensis TaxID=342944 RepID=A0A419V012_9BACL|nr:patatin-like phospholipase family protein [Sinobaca qinghaiensis]RKD71284.1 patatin-like phospholipase [Sinobaca qinghaiensis]
MKQDGLNIGFSGGGFRASYYCLGGYRRLVELGLDHKVQGITSVSGGSITAGAVMKALADGPFTDVKDFDDRVTKPMTDMGLVNIRRKLFWKLLRRPHKLWAPRLNLSMMFPEMLKKEIYGNIKMNELPHAPLWNCNAACLNTMKGFYFNAFSMEGEKIGRSKDIDSISVAFAVAVSAAYPMIFAPVRLSTKGLTFIDTDGTSSYPDVLPEYLYLTDGGVFDNLGTNSILQEEGDFITMDASDRNRIWPPGYKSSFPTRTLRILNISMSEMIYLRREILSKEHDRRGIQIILEDNTEEFIKKQKSFHSIQRLAWDYKKYKRVEELAGYLRTDLDAFNEVEMSVLQWIGAVRMDAALKLLYPEEIPAGKWKETPAFPFEDIRYVEKVLKEGEKRVLW